MMRYALLLPILFLIFSCTSRHPNLESDTIVYDDETLTLLEGIEKRSGDLPKIKLQQPAISQKIKDSLSTAGIKIYNRDAVRKMLLDSLKARNILFYENEITIHAQARSGNIYEMIIGPKGISGVRFKTNKKIRNPRDLKLTCIIFDIARMQKIMNKTMSYKNGQPVYSDMVYSQFKFFDINPFENLNPEDLIDRLTRG